MKHSFLLLLLSISVSFNLSAQTTSVYHLETEYTTQNGYRYYFDKLDPQTGTSVRIAQMPIQGFFTGYAFFNCYGHYVFQGIDSVLTNGQYINKLYEVDTLGNVVRSLPMDTANGTWYKACLPAAGTPMYYALRWNTISGQWNLESINALTGSRTTQVLLTLTNYNFWNSDAIITRDDKLWFGMDDQVMGTSILISVDPLNGQTILRDTLSQGNNYYYDCLNYNCSTDTIYGFISHQDSVNGSELLKINASSGTIIHTGRTAVGTGTFSAGNHTRMATGAFYIRASQAAYQFPDFNVTSPVFIMPNVTTPTTLSTFCFASPRETCSFYTSCEENSVSDNINSGNETTLFPNPASTGTFTIQSEGDFTFEIIDITGRILYAGTAVNSITIAAQSFASGMYTVRTSNNSGTSVNKLVIRN